MAYLGRQPIVGNYQVLDALTATTTDTYALTKNSVAVFPQTPANCIVSLNGVIQAPFDSYNISGSNIVFASALTGSDSIDFITVLGDVLNVGTVSDGTIGLAKLSATGTKDATTFLRGDNTFQTIGANTPAFQASKSSNQSISTSTTTKVTFDVEAFDTDNAFASSTFTVPSGKGGKYFIYAQLQLDTGSGSTYFVSIDKNGSEVFAKRMTSNGSNRQSPAVSAVLNLVATDTVEISTFQDSGVSRDCDGANQRTHFGGYKIIE